MKAVVKQEPGPGHVALIEVDEPKIGAADVLFEVDLCGICGTDLHVRKDTFRNFPPVILGHEFMGRVLEEGSAVKGSTDAQATYAVLGATAVVCGKCRYCQNGYFMFCPERRGMGHGVNGAFTRRVRVRPDQLYRLPESVPVIEGALIEPLAAAVAAVAENTVVRPGDIALVTGPGPIGLLCLMVLVHHGIRTIVAGTAADASRLALAKELGAAWSVEAGKDDLEAVVAEVTNGLGVDVAFEVSGAAPAAGACLGALRPLGSYTQVGHFGKPIDLPFDHVGFKQLRVQGSVGYTRETWRRTIALLGEGLRPSRIVTHQMPLENWENGFNAFARKEAVKVLLQMHD